MSFTLIEDAAKSNQELDALVKDVQRLLHIHRAIKQENDQLRTYA
jgi:hypothetical protein